MIYYFLGSLFALFLSIFFIVIPAVFVFLPILLTYGIVENAGRYPLLIKVCRNTLMFLLIYTTILTIMDCSLRVRSELNIDMRGCASENKSFNEIEEHLQGYYMREKFKFGPDEEYLYYYRSGIFDSTVIWIYYKDGKIKETERYFGWGNESYGIPMVILWNWFLITVIATLIFGFSDLFITKYKSRKAHPLPKEPDKTDGK